MTLVDTHCHLALLSEPADAVLAACAQAGVTRVIDIGMGLAGSAQAAQHAVHYPGRVFASVGIHPNDLSDFAADPDGVVDSLRGLAAGPGVVAIGETGMDLYRDRSSAGAQEAAFRAHIRLAAELDKTLVIHCRSAASGPGDAHAHVLDVLADEDAPSRVVMHCFSGDAEYAHLCAERGYYCSFAGNLTYASAGDLREAAAVVPPELLLVETDAPYLTPAPRRGTRNVPAFVTFTAEALAEVLGEAPGVTARTLGLNAARAFALPAA